MSYPMFDEKVIAIAAQFRILFEKKNFFQLK